MKTEAKTNIITVEGKRKLEEELENRKVNLRTEIKKSIKEAREQGDLSENAEYDAAKEEQRQNESRIEEIEYILKNYEVYDPNEDADGDKINLGCKVTVKDLEFNKDIVYTIVGATEVNLLKKMISIESPVGKALLGHKEGETVTVETPNGEIKLKVLSVTRE
jgi:transcription elongation factor GreA